jgi:hypothetical protein
MDQEFPSLQDEVSNIKILHMKKLHVFKNVPESFHPWESNLSPSALYNCSLSCRKHMKIKTPEVKWMSIKRWVTSTPNGINLPDGVYLSIKRREFFIATPVPKIEKQEFILLMFPYGNVWSQRSLDVPIDEDWIFSKSSDGKLILESLMLKDASRPIQGYFESVYKYMTGNPDQIGIHMKRKKRAQTRKNQIGL